MIAVFEAEAMSEPEARGHTASRNTYKNPRGAGLEHQPPSFEFGPWGLGCVGSEEAN
jgi:hypothetical protein